MKDINMDVKKQKWGFLRETKGMAEKAGIDKDTGLHRTGMEDYLKPKSVIRPSTYCMVVKILLFFSIL